MFLLTNKVEAASQSLDTEAFGSSHNKTLDGEKAGIRRQFAGTDSLATSRVMRMLVRFEDNYVVVDGIRTRYWQTGDKGSPVVLLHGIGCSVLEWNRSLAVLGAHHRVFAVDMPGSGSTEKPIGFDYSPGALADFVLAFIKALNLGAVHLAGNSLGGRVALECALHEPSAVRSLVLAAPAGVGQATCLNFRLASVPLLGELLTRPSKMGLRMLWRRAFHSPGLLEEERIAQKFDDARHSGAQSAFLATLRSFLGLRGFLPGPLGSLHAALPNLGIPTLIVWGRQDRFLPVEQASKLRSLIPSAALTVYDNCGHLPQLEADDKFNGDGLEFWRNLDDPKG